MSWKLEYLPEAEKDLKDLDESQRILVLKAIKKVQQNPLPVEEQGYGKPLGNHSSTNLAGLLKIKLRSAGLRVVYQLRRTESSMMTICGKIGDTLKNGECNKELNIIREQRQKDKLYYVHIPDEEVYEIAQKRANKHNLFD